MELSTPAITQPLVSDGETKPEAPPEASLAAKAELARRATTLSQTQALPLMCSTALFIAAAAAAQWAGAELGRGPVVLALSCLLGAIALVMWSRHRYHLALVRCAASLGLRGEVAERAVGEVLRNRG